MAELTGVRKTESIDGEDDLWPAQPLVRPGTWWWLTAAIAIAIILGLGSVDLISLIARPLAVIFLGITIAATLEPVVDWLGRWLPRTVAVILLYLSLAALVVAIGWLVVPSLWAQGATVMAEFPNLVAQAQLFLERFGRLQEGALGTALAALIDNAGAGAAGAPAAAISIAAGFIVALFISLYWLVQAPDIEAFFLSLFPAPRARSIRRVLDHAAAAMGGYLRGVALNAVIVGAIVYVGLLVIGVDYPLVFALTAGLLELIPVVGPIIAGIVIVGATFFQSTPKALITLAFIIVMQQIENNVLVPNIMSAETNISPLTTIVAIFVGGAVGGVIGVLVSIPLAAFLQVLVTEALAPVLRRRMGAPPVEKPKAGEDRLVEPERIE